MGDYSGFADLGKILAGAGGAKPETAQQRASLELAIQNAKIKRDMAMSRERMREIGPAGMQGIPGATQPQGEFDLNALLSAADPSVGQTNVNKAYGEGQTNIETQRAMDQPLPGQEGYTDLSPDTLNQLMAIAHHASLHPSNVKIMEQVKSKLANEGARTESAHARTANSEASVKAHEASADASRARAEHTRAAPASSGGKKPKPVPQVGDVVKGHRFLGGDPNDQKNWQKVY